MYAIGKEREFHCLSGTTCITIHTAMFMLNDLILEPGYTCKCLLFKILTPKGNFGMWCYHERASLKKKQDAESTNSWAMFQLSPKKLSVGLLLLEQDLDHS